MYVNVYVYLYVSVYVYICLYVNIYMYMYVYLLFLLSFDRWIDVHRFNKDFMIDYRYNRSKREKLLPMDRYCRWST
jgi:hypothetical protein